jgi:predicted metalloprotease with PDZ domain
VSRFARRFAFVIATLCLFLLTFSPKPAIAEIHYEVSIAHPEQHLFRISMEVPQVDGELRLQMAAWNAFYEIRDFSSHVQRVEAYVDGQRTDIEKIDKLTWRVRASGTVKVRYETFWDDPGPFESQLNSDHAFINPAMVLLYVPERRSEKSTVSLTGLPAEWNVASAAHTSVESTAGTRKVTLEAPTYDALADDPIEISKFEEFTISDLTPPVRVVIHGDNWKRREVESALRKICKYEVRMMEDAPYDQYTFIFHIGKAAAGSGGGMEHANSTAISVQSDAFLPNVSAHEFFHLWNVKRIRPATLEPLDYTREMYTRSLWFAEGVTNTYGAYALVRTGLWSKQDFYQDLSSQIREIEVRPAESWQSAEQSSLDAWLEKYALYNQPQNSISYYTKGQILGVLLDIVIRDRTNNQKSLDDVFRTMNVEFAKEGRYYQDSLDVRLTAEKIVGGSLEDFFSKYISGTAQLPYTELLPLAGLELHTHETVRPVLGFFVDHAPSSPWTVGSIDADGPAANSGLKTADEILRWNNSDPPRRLERWLGQQKPGDELHLRIRRDGTEQNIVVRLGEVREKTFQVAEMPHAEERSKRIRDGILHGTTDPVTAKNR